MDVLNRGIDRARNRPIHIRLGLNFSGGSAQSKRIQAREPMVRLDRAAAQREGSRMLQRQDRLPGSVQSEGANRHLFFSRCQRHPTLERDGGFSGGDHRRNAFQMHLLATPVSLDLQRLKWRTGEVSNDDVPAVPGRFDRTYDRSADLEIFVRVSRWKPSSSQTAIEIKTPAQNGLLGKIELSLHGGN